MRVLLGTLAVFCAIACTNSIFAKTVNDDPSKAPTLCAASGSAGILVAHEDCSKFYACSEGRPVALNCPENPKLLYNPEKEYCDWPENVDCGSRAIEKEEIGNARVNSDPSKAPEICANPGSDSTLVAHEDCDKFYKCFRGLPVAMNCPNNLLYNPPRELCDWPTNVDCGDRNKP